MHGVGVPQVVDPGPVAACIAHLGGTKELSQAVTQAGSAIGATGIRPVRQQGIGSGGRPAEATLRIALQFVPGVRGQRHQTRLAELRRLDPERALGAIPVGEREAHEFAAAQAGRVEQHDREAVDRGP